MRGIRTTGVGIGLALSATAGWADDPTPAAKFGRIPGLEPAGAVVLARGQASGTAPQGPMTGTPVPGGPMAPGTPPGGALGMPRPIAGSPSVTELRGPAATFAPPPGLSQPYIAGQPIPVGQPFPVGPPAPVGQAFPVGQPIPVGQPFPVGPPVQVGPPVPVGQPYVVQPGPAVAAPSVLPGADPLLGPAEAPLFGRGLGLFGTPLAGPGRFQANADVALWFIKSAQLPALVTTSSPGNGGFLGVGDTRTLYGDGPQERTFHVGGKFGATYWFGPQQLWGADGNLFFLNRTGREFRTDSNENAVIARPFANLNQGLSFSEIVAFPGRSSGSIAVNSDTAMWGADINLRRHLWNNSFARIDGIAGFRYLNLGESLTITESAARLPGSPTNIGVPNALFGTVTDSFKTENNFYGTQVGLAAEVRRGRWYLDARGTVALGPVTQQLTIGGIQQITYDTGPRTFAGGLLAQPGANIGIYNHDQFAVMPEFAIKLGVHLTPRTRVAVGYNFLYLSRVYRPADQIDPGIDVTRIQNFPLPGNIAPLSTVRPSVPFKNAEVFAQGISFSVQFTW